jgi:hypothetical protein
MRLDPVEGPRRSPHPALGEAAYSSPLPMPLGPGSRLDAYELVKFSYYLLVESTGISEPLPAEPRLGRRTVLTFPLLPPPQKN